MSVTTVDHHTAGEPFRIVTGGAPDLPGATVGKVTGQGIVAEIEGMAYRTGRHTFELDPEDPIGTGFVLR